MWSPSPPTPTPTPTPTATATPPLRSPVPSPAVAEKLAQGDRASATGDFRGALFAYQDAVYLEPQSVAARVKLGRAYLALRYAAQAQAQAEQALVADPSSAEARRLLEDARSAPPRPAGPAAAPAGIAGAASAAAPQLVVSPPAETGAARTQARVYRFTDTASRSAPEVVPDAAESPLPTARAAAEPTPTAAQRYRTALEQMGRREYARAAEELDLAIAQDPRLAVAYAARASARFGLQRYPDAADDYRAALGLDPGLATPVYGLAECYRLLGDPRSAELYQRYAESAARDVRDDLRAVAARRAGELAPR